MAAVAVFAGVVGLGGVAEAATSHIAIRDTATLEARGAAVIVRVVVQCPADYQGDVGIQVSQRVSRNHVTNGFGGTRFTCTGSRQVLRLPAASFDRPFERAVAFAQASFFACPQTEPGSCVDGSTYRTIQII